MSHFKLWRRLRRLASHLFLFFGAWSAPADYFYRVMLPHHSACNRRDGFRSGLILGGPRRSRFDHKSYLAMIGILMACSIEFCGCDLAREPPSSIAFSGGPIMSQLLLPARPLSFYDPSDSVRQLSPAALVGGTPLLPARAGRLEPRLLPWAIPESVYLVYQSGANGPPALARKPLATAFVLSVPTRGRRRFVRFLVTARHVVDPEWARCPGRNPSSIDLRLNRRFGGVGYETISLLPGQRARFFTPSDSTADLVVIPLDESLIANLNEYKFIDVPFRLLPTDSETLQFRAEQPVITARVLSRPSGGSVSYPVFDAGVLARMPAETVDVQCDDAAMQTLPQEKPLHIWFINAGIPQGASGAPVYTAIARGTGATKTPVLLGIQSVAWPEQGVAGITPSLVLRDLIQTALRNERASMDFYKGATPTSKENTPWLY